MAKAKETDAAASAERAEDAREGEAERAEEQMGEEEEAAAKREREAERALNLKSVPDGALAPTEKVNSKGETQFAREWLIANSQGVLGHDSHVVVGALHGDSDEYMTVAQATKKIDTWLNTEVTFDPNEEREEAS